MKGKKVEGEGGKQEWYEVFRLQELLCMHLFKHTKSADAFEYSVGLSAESDQ